MKLKETIERFPQTQIWNDSCDLNELQYAVDFGAVGATTNPVIVLQVLKSSLSEWEAPIRIIAAEHPSWTEDDMAWEVIGRLGGRAAKLLEAEFARSKGKRGRISFQVNAKYDSNADMIVKHGLSLAALVANSQIKAPTSAAGIAAFEELTYQGISINATVSFTVPQAIAVAEAVERGLDRRVREGKPIDTMSPVCTIMAGRVDDYLKKVVDKKGLILDPADLEWAGVAVAKRVYEIYQTRQYRTKLLIAAFRNHYQWSEFIGGDIVLTIPYKWQKRFNGSNITVRERISDPVSAQIIDHLRTIEEFNQAYDPAGLSLDEFRYYGAYQDTINQFLHGYDELLGIIRKYRTSEPLKK